MKHLLTKIILATLILFVTSCTKQDELLEKCTGSCTTITGRLVTANGKEPIVGATVALKWMYGTPSNPKSMLKAKGRTDADGKYSISFYIKDSELTDGFFEAFFSVDRNRYYVISNNNDDGIAFYTLKRDTIAQAKDYLIPRKAYVRLAITNQNQIATGGGQYMSMFNSCYGFNTVFSREIQGGGPSISWYGWADETPVPIPGDQPVIVRNFKVKNGLTTINQDSIFVAAGTTQNYTVTY